jgi:hypothetical protein
MTTQADAQRHIPQLIPRRLLRGGQVHHPAVLGEARRRGESVQLRLADRITAFAGSLKADLELTRQIHPLTEERHKRIIRH